jgi:5-methyltetrahydropteroyltriglutamate--homocysteine methyltransferase
MRRSLCAEEWTYLRARASARAKVTLISPVLAGNYWQPDRSTSAYPTREAYLADVVDVLRREVDELVRLGCDYVQLDSPAYSSLLDPERRAAMKAQGQDPDRRIDETIEAENAIIRGHPGVTFAIHICRGNHRGRYSSRGSYDPIARVFQRTLFDRFLLEYDDPARDGGFEVLHRMPEDRAVVLGLVTTKRPELEDLDLLARRVEEAARFVPLDRLAVSPQCGFASSDEGAIPAEAQRRKLELVGALASTVWGSRWGHARDFHSPSDERAATV